MQYMLERVSKLEHRGVRLIKLEFKEELGKMGNGSGCLASK